VVFSPPPTWETLMLFDVLCHSFVHPLPVAFSPFSLLFNLIFSSKHPAVFSFHFGLVWLYVVCSPVLFFCPPLCLFALPNPLYHLHPRSTSCSVVSLGYERFLWLLLLGTSILAGMDRPFSLRPFSFFKIVREFCPCCFFFLFQ